MPRMAFIGVRISWLMLARKSLLAREAASAAACAASRRLRGLRLAPRALQVPRPLPDAVLQVGPRPLRGLDGRLQLLAEHVQADDHRVQGVAALGRVAPHRPLARRQPRDEVEDLLDARVLRRRRRGHPRKPSSQASASGSLVKTRIGATGRARRRTKVPIMRPTGEPTSRAVAFTTAAYSGPA